MLFNVKKPTFHYYYSTVVPSETREQNARPLQYNKVTNLHEESQTLQKLQ